MLTKDQQEHFDKVVFHFGMPPEGCTHLDASDDTETTFMRLTEDDNLFYWGLDDNEHYEWEEFTANPLNLRLYPVPIKHEGITSVGFADLSQEQQEHLKNLLKMYVVPEGTTHIDPTDNEESSFTKVCDGDIHYYWKGEWKVIQDDLENYYPIPTPPYYNPKDVAFNKRTVKSDGGSSSYYTIPLPAHEIEKIVENGAIETEIIIKYGFGNDFDFGNIQKTLKRLYEISQGGGKEGNTAQYEINKIRYSLAKIEEELNDVK